MQHPRTDAFVRVLEMLAPEALERLRASHPGVRFERGRVLGGGDSPSGTRAGADQGRAAAAVALTTLERFRERSNDVAWRLTRRLHRAAQFRATGMVLSTVASGGAFGAIAADLHVSPALALVAFVSTIIVGLGEYMNYNFHDRSFQPSKCVETFANLIADAGRLEHDISLLVASGAPSERVIERVREAHALAAEMEVQMRRAGYPAPGRPQREGTEPVARADSAPPAPPAPPMPSTTPTV